MKMQKIKKKVYWIIFFLIIICATAHVTYIIAKENSEKRIGIYSWNIENINYDELKEISSNLGVNSFYQYMSYKKINSDESFKTLVNYLDTIDVSTYLLAGTPEYAYDEDINILKSIIDEVAIYNLNNDVKLHGILYDVEFYLDDRYSGEKEQECFEIYYKNMKKAYEYSKEKGIKFILVLPYWIDTKFGNENLEKLIRDACDSVEIMNYYKNKSTEHIALEVEYAKKYKKSIVTISELKAPDDKGSVTEKITFYNDGLSVCNENMKNVSKNCNYNKMGYAYHYYIYLRELYYRENVK